MKKKIVISLLVSVLIAGCGSSSATSSTTETTSETDTEEVIVNEGIEPITITSSVEMNVEDENPDMSGYEWLAYTSPFQEISFDESIRFMEEGGTGIIFYGAEWCAFCQRAIAVLGEAAYDADVTIYYVSLTDRSVSLEQLIELCNRLDWIEWTEEEDGTKSPNFQIPEVIAVKDGEVIGHHLSLVDSFTLVDNTSQMDEDQRNELYNIYLDLFASAAD